MADFEVMLPAQRPVTRALDVVKLCATVIAGVVAIVLQFKKNHPGDTAEALDGNGMLNNGTAGGDDDDDGRFFDSENMMEKLQEIKATLIMLGTYGAKVFMGWKTSHTKYANLIRESVFNKFMDSGHGVRTFLMDAEYQQDFKEVLMAYYFIWQGRAETVAELDDECEQFLFRLLEQVDFEVDDAVKKLTRDGLLHLHGPLASKTRVTSISLRRGITKLDDIWKFMFDDKDIECHICTS